MNIYSRALRHINIEDVKQKHQQKLVEQKLQEQKEKQEKEFISSLMVEKKYDWRKELEKIEEVSVDKFVNYEYDWREKLLDDKKKYFEEGMTSAETFFKSLEATGDVEYPILETDIQISGKDLYLYYDTRVYDTLVVDVRVDPGIIILLTTKPLASFTDSDVLAQIDTSGTYSFSVPQSQNFFYNFLKGYDPEIVDDASGLAAIDDVRAKRTRPLNVFVSLDSPEAAAFIRTDPIMANLSPKERLKKLKEMLEASDEYVLKMLGADFPGTGAVPPGETGDTPGVQMVNYQGKPITDPDDYWRNVTQVSPETFQQIYQQKVASGEITPSTTGVPWTQQQSSTTSSSSSQSSTDQKPGSMYIQVGDKVIKKEYPGTQSQPSDTSDTSGRADPMAIMQALNIPFTDAVAAANRANERAQQKYQQDLSAYEKALADDKQKADELSKAVAAARAEYLKQGQTPAQRQQAYDKLQAAIKAGTDHALSTLRNPITPPVSPESEPQQKLTPEQLANIEASMKQLQLDNEKIKADANRRNWELAAEIGMNALTVATLFNPIPGDEAVVIGARTASQTARMARNFARQNPGKYNPFLSDKANQLARKQGVGTNVKGQNPAFRNPKSSGSNSGRINNTSLLDSYEPEGEVISEKRKLKSPQEILNKIPGYYDGKPAPLGFPIEPPPEMKNGMHPDLVDGKKVADRFNRLDPESAKAMPPTGNPHIDKKVRASAKKPK